MKPPRHQHSKQRTYLTISILLAAHILVKAQITPTAIPVLDEQLRRQQLQGDTTIKSSLMIRPSFEPAHTPVPSQSTEPSAFRKNAEFRLMPLVWKQQYTTDHPLSHNDGAMIPARGYQTLISGGFFARYGIVSLQLMPELVYAENKYFEGFPEKHKLEAWKSYNSYKARIDLPDRFGNEPYRRAFWGQSSLRLTYKSLSLGLSNENLWWGPGQKNALMMSSNAPGFKHITFNTVKPVVTPIGSFEWQLMGGRLDGSGFAALDTVILKNKGITPYTKSSDWQYMNALTVNYQPRWLPGLSIGAARSYTIYSKFVDFKNYKTWFPIVEPILKVNAGGHERDTLPSDQIITVWVRWLMPKEHSEVYIEFGRQDHNWHLNDFLLEPAHTRAYIIGFRKLVPLNNASRSFIDVQLELTQFSHNVTTLLRPYSSMATWYSSGGQGFTHKGQIVGAGIGTSSNMQLVNIGWVSGNKRIGLELYRHNHDEDFWEHLKLNRLGDYRTHWVDISGALVADWPVGKFMMNLRMQTVGALNYMFLYDPVLTEPPYFWDYGKPRYNVNAVLTLVYPFR